MHFFFTTAKFSYLTKLQILQSLRPQASPFLEPENLFHIVFIDDRDQSNSLVLGENPCITVHKLIEQIRLHIITVLFAKYQDEITTGCYGSKGGIQSLCVTTISFAWTGPRR